MKLCLTESRHFCRKVGYIDDYAIPATRLCFASVRHRLGRSSGSERRAEHQFKIFARKHCKVRGRLLLYIEPEVLCVKLNRRTQLVDHVSYSYGCHIALLL